MTKPPYKCKCGQLTWSPVLKCDDCWRAAMDQVAAVEAAQKKLEQMRYERTHFSDGTPVALYEGIEAPPYCFGMIQDNPDIEGGVDNG